MDYQLNCFKDGLNELGIELSDEQIAQFLQFYELLIEKNKVMNLTAITEFDEAVNKHFLDSLSLVKILDVNSVATVLDIGTGAGFPGIPLKIAFPHLKITLVDSVNKKIGFLQEVISIMDLQDVDAVHGRVEDLGHDISYREKYDLVVSRAVASLPSLAEYCIPFVKMNGYFLSYKSGRVDEEIGSGKKAIQVLGGKMERDVRFQIPGTDMERALLLMKKEKPSPKKYPRKVGTPTKTPIR